MKFKKLSLAVIFVCGLLAQMPVSSAAETAAAPAKTANGDLDDTLWGVAERANTVDDYQVYLDSFPQGKYVPFAKSRIKRLQAAVQAPAPQPVLTASGKMLVEPVMVSIPGKDFEIGKYEVTQKEWRDIMGDNPSEFKACGDNCPVEQVSWTDAKKFIAKLNQRSEKEYRLPTEDEWLDACADSCGGNEKAWTETNSGGATHPVGQKQPNSYGLYDMSGNVAEWVSDEWGSSNESAVGVVIVGSLGKRALLGGDYDTKPGETRGIDRRGLVQATRDRHIGFRLARTLK
jgi:hypothetical protein